MARKMIKLDKYFVIATLSLILGLTRYYLYDNNDFNLFSLVDKNKKEIEIDLTSIEDIISNQSTLDKIRLLESNMSDEEKKVIEIHDGILKKQEISYQEAYFLYSKKLAAFIDARSMDEIEKEGEILGSLSIPVNHIDDLYNNFESLFDPSFLNSEDYQDAKYDHPSELKTFENLNQLDREGAYVIYCGHSKCPKSQDLYNYMKNNLGFKKLFKYTGGWEDWKTNEAFEND